MHKRSSRKEQNRMIKVFIDGKSGTTGLRIYDRLNLRSDVTIITLPEEVRHDPEARREAIKSADAAFFCLPDDAARESALPEIRIRLFSTHRPRIEPLPDGATAFRSFRRSEKPRCAPRSVSPFRDVTQAASAHLSRRLRRRGSSKRMRTCRRFR